MIMFSHPLVNVVSVVVGSVFLLGCALIWFSDYVPRIKKWMEDLFVPGNDLFDSKASHSGTVTFFRWWGWLVGTLFVLPTFVVLDLLILLSTVWLWMYLARRARRFYNRNERF